MVYYRDFITTSVSRGAGPYNLHTSHEFNPLIFSVVYVVIYYVNIFFVKHCLSLKFLYVPVYCLCFALLILIARFICSHIP